MAKYRNTKVVNLDRLMRYGDLDWIDIERVKILGQIDARRDKDMFALGLGLMSVIITQGQISMDADVSAHDLNALKLTKEILKRCGLKSQVLGVGLSVGEKQCIDPEG